MFTGNRDNLIATVVHLDDAQSSLAGVAFIAKDFPAMVFNDLYSPLFF